MSKRRRGDRHRRFDDGEPHDGREALDAEQTTGRGDDQAAGREADEEHEADDVEAPDHVVAHVGDLQAADQLVDPDAEAEGDERDEQTIHSVRPRERRAEPARRRSDVTVLTAHLPRRSGLWDSR